MDIIEGNKLIAEMGSWKLATNYPPNVYENGSQKITGISFHKPKLFGELMRIVNKLEQENDLYIIIKRKQCTIQKMHFTSNRTLVDIEGKTKQDAIWKALIEYNTQQPSEIKE